MCYRGLAAFQRGRIRNRNTSFTAERDLPVMQNSRSYPLHHLSKHHIRPLNLPPSFALNQKPPLQTISKYSQKTMTTSTTPSTLNHHPHSNIHCHLHYQTLLHPCLSSQTLGFNSPLHLHATNKNAKPKERGPSAIRREWLHLLVQFWPI